jgi:hypothetical protein
MNPTGQTLRLAAQGRRAGVVKVADSAGLALQNRRTHPHPTPEPVGPRPSRPGA